MYRHLAWKAALIEGDVRAEDDLEVRQLSESVALPLLVNA